MNTAAMLSGRTRRSVGLLAVTLAVALVAGLGIWWAIGEAAKRDRQAEVAARGARVMPFDLEQTKHIFQPMDDGGLQTVIAKDPSNAGQVALIRAHLQEGRSASGGAIWAIRHPFTAMRCRDWRCCAPAPGASTCATANCRTAPRCGTRRTILC